MTLSPNVPKTSSEETKASRRQAKPRRNASLVIAALAAVCCFNLNQVNANDVKPAPQEKPKVESKDQLA